MDNFWDGFRKKLEFEEKRLLVTQEAAKALFQSQEVPVSSTMTQEVPVSSTMNQSQEVPVSRGDKRKSVDLDFHNQDRRESSQTHVPTISNEPQEGKSVLAETSSSGSRVPTAVVGSSIDIVSEACQAIAIPLKFINSNRVAWRPMKAHTRSALAHDDIVDVTFIMPSNALFLTKEQRSGMRPVGIQLRHGIVEGVISTSLDMITWDSTIEAEPHEVDNRRNVVDMQVLSVFYL